MPDIRKPYTKLDQARSALDYARKGALRPYYPLTARVLAWEALGVQGDWIAPGGAYTKRGHGVRWRHIARALITYGPHRIRAQGVALVALAVVWLRTGTLNVN